MGVAAPVRVVLLYFCNYKLAATVFLWDQAHRHGLSGQAAQLVFENPAHLSRPDRIEALCSAGKQPSS